MDWTLFWTAFGAIGGTVGAIATTAAVIVALWQTKYANKKKLKVEFCDNIRLVASTGNPLKQTEYVGITVTNIGNRNVKLIDWRVMLPDKRGAIILQDNSPIGKAMSSPWPMTLEPEEQASQHWDKNLFFSFVLDEVPTYSNKDRKKKLCWIVKDSTGRNYKTVSQKTLQQYFDDATEWKDRNHR